MKKRKKFFGALPHFSEKNPGDDVGTYFIKNFHKVIAFNRTGDFFLKISKDIKISL